MVYQFHSVKSITDEIERRQRLAALFRIFEDTPSTAITRQDESAVQGAEAQPTNKVVNRLGEYKPAPLARSRGSRKNVS